jgi:hypothetical protein
MWITFLRDVTPAIARVYSESTEIFDNSIAQPLTRRPMFALMFLVKRETD